jgi:uncharacterized membrane protein YgcG
MITLKRTAVAPLLALALLVMALAPANAAEKITRFISDVNVQRSGDLLVTETIEVAADGDRIKRGILRDFPTSYKNRDGSHVEIGFEVLSVKRDGALENYTTERLDNGTRVRIGRADSILTTGRHEYIIAYRTTRQIGFFKEFDELYWNATGTGWTFPIDMAEARITLPEAVSFRNNALYTGPQGANGKDATVVEQRPGYIVFRTTRLLPAANGLTVAASWEKGLITRPSDTEKQALWLRDNLPLAVAALGLLLVAGYYVFAWRRVGHDPREGTIIPLFAPPDGMSPAAVRYVSRMNCDDKTFSAALVDLAVHGHIKIAETENGMRIGPRQGGQAVDAAEAAANASMFGKRTSSLALEPENALIFQRAQKALKQQLAAAYAGKLFRTNKDWSVSGLLAALAVIAAVVLSAYLSWGSYQGSALIIGMLSFLPVVIVLTILATFGLPRVFIAYPFLIFGCVFGFLVGQSGYGIMMEAMHGWMPAVPAALPLILVPMASSAFTWMRSYTVEGRRVADQIEGFRHYLGVAEEDRLNALNPPEKTPELFEKFLPYAIALDVENAWAKRFAGVLAAMATADLANDWYSSSRDHDRNPTTLATSLGSGLATTIASASTPPGSSGNDSSSSSSSGSDGGGSSGGGGGGGGGDGW